MRNSFDIRSNRLPTIVPLRVTFHMLNHPEKGRQTQKDKDHTETMATEHGKPSQLVQLYGGRGYRFTAYPCQFRVKTTKATSNHHTRQTYRG